MKRLKAARKAVLMAVATAGLMDGALACGPNGGGFLPDNNLSIPVTPGSALSGRSVTEAKFNEILDKIERLYAPVVTQKGGRLVLQRAWSNGTVNAFAERQGSNWVVKMFGGLARHQAVTADGFALVACHELGHHLGGVPRYPREWASNEGQADYFATLKCLRKLWADEDNVQAAADENPPASVTAKCEQSFADHANQALCQRVAMAGLSSGRLMAVLDGTGAIDFDRPDPSRVQQTFDSHPKAQCRLDTYYNGSLCQVRAEEEIGQSDPTVGVCAQEKGADFGFRPLCWYKPVSSGGGGGGDGSSDLAPQPTISGQTDILITNPYQQILIQYDVSRLRGATGAYVEIVGPNGGFAEPNGNRADTRRILWGSQRGLSGVFALTRPLPAWGIYQYRVIALGGNGEYAVGRFSNASLIRLQPQQIGGGSWPGPVGGGGIGRF